MEKFETLNGVSVRAYKGDAMTLLAFDLEPNLRDCLAGFTIKYRYKLNGKTVENYIFNRLVFPDEFYIRNPGIPKKDRNSTLYSPIQKFNWVHVPNTNINTEVPVFGDYEYEITPRYIRQGVLEALNPGLTVTVPINVSPFDMKSTKVGFTRGFVSSVAYAKRFNVENNRVRPPKAQDTLLFDVTQVADTAKRWNDITRKYEDVPYTFEEQHKWLGWQARQRIIDFLDEVINDASLSMKVFAFDLDEPEICRRLLTLAADGRLKIILDDDKEKHGQPDSMESTFEAEFANCAVAPSEIARGHYKALAHSKVFIQVKNNKAVKVLTGSTNFSTNGIYINSNHVLVFDSKNVAQIYSDVFDVSFGQEAMDSFRGSEYSVTEYGFTDALLPAMTITFAPHTKEAAQKIFDRINGRILKDGNTDVLFAIMRDTSASSILDAVKAQVRDNKVFTYGITDSIGNDADYNVYLYKPNALRGIRVAAKGIANALPEPFGQVAGIVGYAIHHKFVVVNFRGDDPVVYCGSSNLAFGPEQKNGDNLLEIHDKDIVTAFAIEALRLVDHFHWRNSELKNEEMFLDDIHSETSAWYQAWYVNTDLKCRQRELYIKGE